MVWVLQRNACVHEWYRYYNNIRPDVHEESVASRPEAATRSGAVPRYSEHRNCRIGTRS